MKKQSKHNQIKAHLESGKTITGLKALHYYGLYNLHGLSSVIYRLRKKGMKIRTVLYKGYATYSIIK